LPPEADQFEQLLLRLQELGHFNQHELIAQMRAAAAAGGAAAPDVAGGAGG
jgi:hypothetical protein